MHELLKGLLLDETLDIHFGLEKVIFEEGLSHRLLFFCGLFQKGSDFGWIALLLGLFLLLELLD